MWNFFFLSINSLFLCLITIAAISLNNCYFFIFIVSISYIQKNFNTILKMEKNDP